MTVMEVFSLLLVLFAGGTFLISIISFAIKVLETRDKKESSHPRPQKVRIATSS